MELLIIIQKEDNLPAHTVLVALMKIYDQYLTEDVYTNFLLLGQLFFIPEISYAALPVNKAH